jgi:hypothetical protein
LARLLPLSLPLRTSAATATPDLCDRLADIEGTDLPGLIENLSPDPQTAEQTLQTSSPRQGRWQRRRGAFGMKVRF